MELMKQVGPKGEGERYAGALVLRELAEHAPAVLYDRRTEFFDNIWLVVNDLTVSDDISMFFPWGMLIRKIAIRTLPTRPPSRSKQQCLRLRKVSKLQDIEALTSLFFAPATWA